MYTRHQHKVQNQESLPGVVKTKNYNKEKIKPNENTKDLGVA